MLKALEKGNPFDFQKNLTLSGKKPKKRTEHMNAATFNLGFLVCSLAFAAIAFFVGRRSVKSSLFKKLDELHALNEDLSGSAEQVAAVSKDIASSSLEQLDTISSTAVANHEIRSMIERTGESTG